MIKKVLLLSTVLFGMVGISTLSADQCCAQPQPECPCDQPVGECYCKYVRYRLNCNYTKRCVEEQVPCTRRCTRQVPEYYTVQKCRQRTETYCVPVQQCRYVPEYYTVPCQKCRYVPEYYTVNIPKCRYVPQYYTVNVQRCRSVPEYYCEQRCAYRTECYDVPECKTRKTYVCEPNYSCIPEYYWKYECGPNGQCN